MDSETKGSEIISPDASETGFSNVNGTSSAFPSIVVPAQISAIGAAAAISIAGVAHAGVGVQGSHHGGIPLRSVIECFAPGPASLEELRLEGALRAGTQGQVTFSQSSSSAFSTKAQAWTATSPSAPMEAIQAVFPDRSRQNIADQNRMVRRIGHIDLD
jgi:hypothetical protein